MIVKVMLRRLLAGLYVLPFPVFLLGLAHYSYRAKELLVCWLFFCSFLAVLALLFLSAALAWYAGQKLVELSRVAKTLAPNPVLWLAQLLQEAVSTPRSIVAGDVNPSTGPAIAVSVLDLRSCPVVEVVLPMEVRVQK
jgi:hypothetical protein